MEFEETGTGTVLQGFAASGGIIEGPCRVITDVKGLAKIEEDAILVFPTSAPEIAAVMTRLAGVVTAEGGRLAGATHYAREEGVPCVTGVKGCMEAVWDGQIIRVDGFEGTVTLL
jgi:pyruvate,water dikinase